MLGRAINVMGEPIDGLGDIEVRDTMAIHREPPALRQPEARKRGL